MSWPHFLHGDPQLRKNLIGMAPDEEKHSFIMDVLPKYGIALRAFARLQMNVAVEKSDGFGWFDKINQEKIYLPVLWFEEGIGGPSEVLKHSNMSQGAKHKRRLLRGGGKEPPKKEMKTASYLVFGRTDLVNELPTKNSFKAHEYMKPRGGHEIRKMG